MRYQKQDLTRLADILRAKMADDTFILLPETELMEVPFGLDMDAYELKYHTYEAMYGHYGAHAKLYGEELRKRVMRDPTELPDLLTLLEREDVIIYKQHISCAGGHFVLGVGLDRSPGAQDNALCIHYHIPGEGAFAVALPGMNYAPRTQKAPSPSSELLATPPHAT